MKMTKLTPAQRKRVRELMTDEGATREEAVAWVRAFEPPGTTVAQVDARARQARAAAEKAGRESGIPAR